MEELVVKVNGKEYKVKIEESANGKIIVYHEGRVYEVETKTDIEPIITEDIEKISAKEGEKSIKAPMPGTIVSVNVKKGSKVKQGDTLLKIIAMKMENEIVAPKDGIIKEVKIKKKDNVNKNDILILME